MISFLIFLVVVILVAGLCVGLLRRAPFIDADLKQWAEWAILAIAVVLIVVRALALIGINAGI